LRSVQQEDIAMVKRPSFPVYRVVEPPSRRSFDRRLTLATLALAIIVVAALVVRAAGPIPETPSDPTSSMVGP
jgi:hypothetical protein